MIFQLSQRSYLFCSPPGRLRSKIIRFRKVAPNNSRPDRPDLLSRASRSSFLSVNLAQPVVLPLHFARVVVTLGWWVV